MRMFVQNIKVKIIIHFILILIIITFSKCTTSSPDKAIDTTVVKPVMELKQDKGVSLIRLISNPEMFDKKLIRAEGYLNIEFEGNALYLHKEDYDLGITENSIWVDIAKKDIVSPFFQNCSRKYVLIEGTFDAKNKGHKGGFNGSITQITRVEVIKK